MGVGGARQISISDFQSEDEGSTPLPTHQPTQQDTKVPPNETQIYLRQADTDYLKTLSDRIIRSYHSYTPKTTRVGRYIDWIIERHTVKRNKHGKVVKVLNKEVIGVVGLMDTPALNSRPRDRMIGWNKEEQTRNMHKVVANYRFTLMPNAQPNEASQVLSILTKICRKQWQEKYHRDIVFIETVIKVRKIRGLVMTGQCYKASGWRLLGLTSGGGATYHRLKFNGKGEGGELRDLTFKGDRLRIWVKPLINNFREELKK